MTTPLQAASASSSRDRFVDVLLPEEGGDRRRVEVRSYTASAGLTLAGDAFLEVDPAAPTPGKTEPSRRPLVRNAVRAFPFTGYREPPEWQGFLERLASPGAPLDQVQARAFKDLWTYLRVALGPSLPVPQVEPAEDGAVKLSWSRDSYYAEIEVHAPDDQHRCLHEWFIRDRRVDLHDGSDEPEPSPPPRRFLELLGHAIRG